MPVPTRTRTAHPPTGRPVLLFDGECGFCRRWIERWRVQTAGRVDFEPYQQAADRFPDLPHDAFAQAVQLVTPDGEVHAGADAVFRVLATTPGHGVLHRVYTRVPLFARSSEAVYGLVARHRIAASRATRLLFGRDTRPATWVLTRWLLLRALGLVAFAAFASLHVQLPGLVGDRGIAPASRLLADLHALAVQHSIGPSMQWLEVPTLAWLHPTAGFVQGLCSAGMVASLLLIADLAPAAALTAVWLLYLSLCTVGGVFLGYQWDALLLETAFCALFLVPWRVRPGLDAARPPSRAGLWLQRLLAFKLMFLAGAVKWLGRDPTWHSLDALRFHFWTQPLPDAVSWYANTLPPWMLRGATLGLFAIELGAPWLIFGPPRARRLAFWSFALLQGLIALTGHYGFFNALAMVPCLALMDDAALRALVPARLRPRLATPDHSPLPRTVRIRRTIACVPAALVVVVSVVQTVGVLAPTAHVPHGLDSLVAAVEPFDSDNRYGLFAVMTTERPEIVVEGSLDGEHWRVYPFRYKPGALDATPAWVMPGHMPRLDWQMWFAGLAGRCTRTRWYPAFVRRLLEASPEVLDLLASDPFEGHPPLWIRSTLYRYRFTTVGERRASGAIWQRERIGSFCPTLALRDGNLVQPALDADAPADDASRP